MSFRPARPSTTSRMLITGGRLELLATVHWVVTHEGITDREQITRAVHTWNARKQQFSSAQITLALDRLREQGWLKMAVA